MTRIATAAAIAVLFAPSSNTEAQVRIFTGLGDGTTFTDPLNWTGGNVPDTRNEIAEISGEGLSVSLPTSIDLGGLLLGDQSNLRIRGGASLNLYGDIESEGTITINSDGVLSPAALIPRVDVTFTGQGRIDLMAPNRNDLQYARIGEVGSAFMIMGGQVNGSGQIDSPIEDTFVLTGGSLRFGPDIQTINSYLSIYGRSALVDFQTPEVTSFGLLAPEEGAVIEFAGELRNEGFLSQSGTIRADRIFNNGRIYDTFGLPNIILDGEVTMLDGSEIAQTLITEAYHFPGSLELGGRINVGVGIMNARQPRNDETITLIQADGGITGNFLNAPSGSQVRLSLLSGEQPIGTFYYGPDSPYGPNQVVLDIVFPEPTSLTLGAIAACGSWAGATTRRNRSRFAAA